MNKKPVCVCVAQWHSGKKPKKHKACLTNFRILLIISCIYF